MSYKKRLGLYFLLLIVPMIFVFALTYFLLSNGMVEQLKDRESASLRYFSNETESMLENIDSLSIQLALNYTSYSSISDDIINLPYEQLTQCLKNTSNIVSTNESVGSIYIYYKDNSRIIMNDQFYKWDSFKDKEWLSEYLTSINNEPEIALLLNKERVAPLYNGETEKKLISYVRPFPINTEYKIGYIVININTNKMFKEVFDSSQVEHIVLNNYNEAIYCDSISNMSKLNLKDEYFKKDGNKYFLNYTTCKNGWKYISLVEQSKLLSPLNTLKYIIIVTIFIGLVIMILMAIKTTDALYRPLQEIMDMLGINKHSEEELKSKNEFEFIKNKFIKYMNEKENADKNIKINSMALKDKKLLNMLRGEKNIDDIGYNLNIFPEGWKNFQVGTIILDNIDYNIENRLYSILKMHFSYLFELVSIDSKMYSFILYCMSDESLDKENIAMDCEHVINDMLNQGIEGFIGIGNVVTSEEELNFSYINSIWTTKYRIFSEEKRVLLYENINYNSCKTNYYSIDMENKLLNALKEKKDINAKKYVQEIFNNIREGTMSIDYVYARLKLVRDILFCLPTSVGYNVDEVFEGDHVKFYEEFNQYKTLNQLQKYFNNIIDLIFDSFNKKSRNKNAELIEDIKKYILNNMSTDVSLNSIADNFQISVPYLSTIFKQETGENFAKYIFDLKMNFALSMIKETNMNIKDISEKIGYFNERSFYNAFKKHTGQSPVEYRKQYKRQSL